MVLRSIEGTADKAPPKRALSLASQQAQDYWVLEQFQCQSAYGHALVLLHLPCCVLLGAVAIAATLLKNWLILVPSCGRLLEPELVLVVQPLLLVLVNHQHRVERPVNIGIKRH